MQSAEAATGDGADMREPDIAQKKGVETPRWRLLLRKVSLWYLDGTEQFWPFSDFAIRFFIGVWFWRSGLVKATHWDRALYLAENEYPVSWLEPANAAALGLSIELIGPILLIAGAFTRPAAFALAALTVISQTVYLPTTSNLLVIAMLGWYVLAGPGALSVDWAMALKAKSSSMRPPRWVTQAGAWTRRNLAPVWMALIRIWLGVSLLVHAGWFDPPVWVQTWLPTSIFYNVPGWIALLAALLFFSGLGAVVVSYGLFFLIGYYMIAEAHPNVTLFPFLFLSMYEARGAGVFSLDRAILKWLDRNGLLDRPEGPEPDTWVSRFATRLRLGWVLRLARSARFKGVV